MSSDGRVMLGKGAAEGADLLPGPDLVMRDRLVVQDLLDHYDEIEPGSSSVEAPAANSLAASPSR